MPSTAKHLTVGADKFAASLENILSGVETNISECIVKPVSTAVRYGAKVARWSAPMRTGEYCSGFTSKTDRTGKRHCIGTVYNKKKPGLVHLLEKGHNRVVNGVVVGRAKAYPHMIIAADETFALLEKELDKAIDRGLNL